MVNFIEDCFGIEINIFMFNNENIDDDNDVDDDFVIKYVVQRRNIYYRFNKFLFIWFIR